MSISNIFQTMIKCNLFYRFGDLALEESHDAREGKPQIQQVCPLPAGTDTFREN